MLRIAIIFILSFSIAFAYTGFSYAQVAPPPQADPGVQQRIMHEEAEAEEQMLQRKARERAREETPEEELERIKPPVLEEEVPEEARRIFIKDIRVTGVRGFDAQRINAII